MDDTTVLRVAALTQKAATTDDGRPAPTGKAPGEIDVWLVGLRALAAGATARRRAWMSADVAARRQRLR